MIETSADYRGFTFLGSKTAVSSQKCSGFRGFTFLGSKTAVSSQKCSGFRGFTFLGSKTAVSSQKCSGLASLYSTFSLESEVLLFYKVTIRSQNTCL
jgi:hypothetical protein